MTVLTVQEATVAFGAETIFSGVHFLLRAGERLALVGPNGAGKSTLLRAIAGQVPLAAGRVSVAPGHRVAYLAQDPELEPDRSVYDEAAAALSHLQRWEAELRALERRMSGLSPGPELDAALERYGRLRTRYEGADAYSADARVKAVLFGLGFSPGQLTQRSGDLSGGQKVRLGLARLLLAEPDVMLLDEPTNHLDLESVEWLESHLRSSRSAAVVVSHDRYFLDAVTGATLELDRGRGYFHPGSYTQYLQAREQRLQQDADAWRRHQEEVESLKAYIRRYKAGNRATMAKSREKRLERLQAAAPERPDGERASMHLAFDLRHESGNEVLRIEGLAKAYGENVLFRDLTAQVERGRRLALVGPNGAGKTTLLKILHQILPPDAGRVWWGVGVKRGYFSQDLDQVDSDHTVLAEMLALPGMTIFQARSLLARFLFRGEAVERRVGDLSGGERNRLTLAKLVLSGANVLLLDEPTNHLDLESKQVLEEALLDYPGTVLMVSHDRYFLDRVATHIWAFAGGTVAEYAGNFSAWRAALAAAPAGGGAGTAPARPAAADAANAAPGEVPGCPAAEGAEPGPARRARSGNRRAERQLQGEIRRLEAEIEALEARKADLAAALADPDTYRGLRGRELAAEYQAVERELERLYVAWERALEQSG